MPDSIQFTNLTRHTEIGANSYLIEWGGKKLVLDCGMHPKAEGMMVMPDFGPLRGLQLDAILISHTHQDHIGTLPVLMRQQPHAKVFMTYPTGRMGDVMLHNSVNVMTRQREETGNSVLPLFTHRETENAVHQWQYVPLDQEISLRGERAVPDEGELSFEMVDAGHILGSAGILLRHRGRTVLYTGDVNFSDQTLSKAASFPEAGVDVLIIETTRGDNPVVPGTTRESEEKRFAQALRDAFERGGSILIPVFAIGKTQEVLTLFYEMKRNGQLATVPIYIGGLSTKMTMIHDELARGTVRQHAGLQILDVVAPYVLSGKEAQYSSPGHGKIFAISSGMMTEKTLSNVFAQKFIEDPKHSIFFVGYADPLSPGGKLRNALPGSEIVLDKTQPTLQVKATIEKFDFSAHATRESLLAYILKLNPPTTVLVHGDLGAVEWFRNELEQKAPQMRVVIPPPGQAVEL